MDECIRTILHMAQLLQGKSLSPDESIASHCARCNACRLDLLAWEILIARDLIKARPSDATFVNLYRHHPNRVNGKAIADRLEAAFKERRAN